MGTNMPTGSGNTGFMNNLLGKAGNLLEDRNFLNILAGIGTELDPEGAGGMIGRPTQQMIRSTVAQENAEASAKATKDFQNLLYQVAMGKGGMSPAGEGGGTKLTTDGKQVTVTGDMPKGGLGDLGGPVQDTTNRTTGGSNVSNQDLMSLSQVLRVG